MRHLDSAAQVTVCIPAYKAGSFIAETVRSVLGQSYSALTLHIAIDPPDDGSPDLTWSALSPFRGDRRVVIRKNPKRLGWAGNINAMMGRIETEYFVLLPHDDLWTKDYLAKLVPMLMARPDASVAYADMTTFGTPKSFDRSVVLPFGESRAMHLVRFFVEGARAMPWRGVTRTSCLSVTDGFPRDPYRGFAVECEYALDLLRAGEALHLPESIYRKRRFRHERVPASRERLTLATAPELDQAWQRHQRHMRDKMERMIAALDIHKDMAELCRHAATAAMLLRRQKMVRPGLSDTERAGVDAAMSACLNNSHPLAPDVHRQLTSVLDQTG
ncbi:MAG: glycosyltransferase [Pseudomonadota bacterium]